VQWSTGTVERDGERIYYELTEPDGAARGTVVLGHGAGGSHAAWFQQVLAFGSAGFRVVTWDTRGFGNSTCRSESLSTVASVGDLAAVLDATGVERAHVVGQSMGGWWATGFALAHPDRSDSLVLANTVGGIWTDALRAHFRTLLAPASAGPTQLGQHSAVGPQLATRDLALSFLYQQLNTFHEPPMTAVIGAITGTSHTVESVAALDVPKLWITTTHDQLFPAALVAETAAEVGARCEVIADAGHSPYFERADAWNDVVLAFLTDG
jgi:pimeloyl-ACP methyl ester carboxylesterase